MGAKLCLASACLLILAGAAGAQDKGTILEEVVARVNNDIITRSDLDRAGQQLRGEIHSDCRICTPAQIDARYAEQEKDLLRDLIDNSLLVQRAKDMSINVDTQVIKRLDEVRINNNIDSMEDLEKQITQSGEDFEDFKNHLRDQLLQQEVIRREVGARIIVDHADVQKYYDAHKDEFVRPEQVTLREIFVSSEGKSEDETAALRKKADGLLQRVRDGEDFGELAKRFSDGSTAKQSGDLGTFERGQLVPSQEQIVFKMQRNDVTDVLPTKAGFLILQVRAHYPSGQQPEDKVEDEIMNKLYSEKMKPTMRDYLHTLRVDSYLQVKAGFVDTDGADANNIDEVPPTDDSAGKKTGHKLLPFGKKKNGA